jgi:ABC-type phosphate transport system substrate-binding protein
MSLGGGSVAAADTGGGDSAVTVPGPVNGSTVSVDQTKNLVNQIVHVTWTGFKPSILSGDPSNVVRVYQCKMDSATGVSSPTLCYGNQEFGTPLSGIPEGPSNAVDTFTAKDKTGFGDIEVRTSVESPLLGCGDKQACAIVVVPNWGDAHGNNSQVGYVDQPWSWANRVIIPIFFQPTASVCGLGDADVSSAGAPLMARAIAQWQPKICLDTPAVKLDYSNTSEPQARAQFLTNGLDVALTSQPADALVTTKRTYDYAPVSISSLVVAFRTDDATTNLPITTMKLNARLLAKLITESYGLVSYNVTGEPPPPTGTWDKNVTDNPITMFKDPEFLQLNPGHDWTSDSAAAPLLLADNSDTTYALTQYIESDPDAKAFLSGKPDPWGMHVNWAYKNVGYPIDGFELQDPDSRMGYVFAPISGMPNVARNLVTNSYAGVSPDVDQFGQHPKLGTQAIGRRSLIAIIDNASATAFRFPVAQLQNAAGAYVAPTTDSMTAALSDMTADSAGLKSVDFTKKDAAAYPLTMRTYAMVPTSGLTSEKANKVADFLEFAVAKGQTLGVDPGNLAPGNLPLPADDVAATQKIEAAVRAQKGAVPPPPSHEGAGGGGGSGSGGDNFTTTPAGSDTPITGDSSVPGDGSTGDGGTGGTTPTGSASTTANNAANKGKNAGPTELVGLRAPAVKSSLGFANMVLPLLLIVGLVAAGVGPMVLMFAKDGPPEWWKRRSLKVPKVHMPGRRNSRT